MVTEKLLSFIIPAYNVEAYIEVCLRSFLNPQALEQIEVIVVNDGSSDRTEEIVQSYVNQYPSVFRLHSQKNGGHGKAINSGTRLAEGKYFKVIDADDWIITENLPELLAHLSKLEADVVLTPFHQVSMADRSRETWRMYCSEYGRPYTLEEVVASFRDFDRCLTFHGIMYRTDFYRAYGHVLPEKVYYEDQEFASIPCCHASSIVPIDLFLYQYLVGNSQQSVSMSNRVKRIGDIARVSQNILRYLKEHPELNAAAKEYLFKKAEVVVLSYYVTACLFQADKQKGIAQAKQYTKEILALSPELAKRVEGKYRLYCLMARLHIPNDWYEKAIRSKVYSLLRKTHRLEKESD